MLNTWGLWMNPPTGYELWVNLCLIRCWSQVIISHKQMSRTDSEWCVHGARQWQCSAARGSMSNRSLCTRCKEGVKEFAPTQLPWYATSQPRAETSDIFRCFQQWLVSRTPTCSLTIINQPVQLVLMLSSNQRD